MQHTSLLLFLISCGLPAFSTPTYPGLLALLLGWLTIPFGVVAWLANPLYLIAYFCSLGKGPREWIEPLSAILALGLGLTTLVQTISLPDGFNGSQPAHIGPGTGVWIAALAAQALVSLFRGEIVPTDDAS